MSALRLNSLTSLTVDDVVWAADEALANASDTSWDENSRLLERIAELIEGEVPVIAEVISREMGKTFAAAKGEVAKCAMAVRYFASVDASTLTQTVGRVGSLHATLRWRPSGTVVLASDWRYPWWDAVRTLAASLRIPQPVIWMAPARVSESAAYLAHLITRAGAHPGLVSLVPPSHDTLAAFMAHDHVAVAVVTHIPSKGPPVEVPGSYWGRKTIVEYRGRSSAIVTNATDLTLAIPAIVNAALQNNGQSLWRAQRILIPRQRRDEALAHLSEALSMSPTGDPFEPRTVVGPLMDREVAERFHRQCADTVAQGAHVGWGELSTSPDERFASALLLLDTPVTSPAWCEDVDGPLIAVRWYDDLATAIDLLNDTPRNVGVALWSSDENDQIVLEQRSAASTLAINAPVTMWPMLPWPAARGAGSGDTLGELGLKELMHLQVTYCS